MKPIGVVIHHTAGNEQNAEQLRSAFKSRFGVNYIGYHVAIFPDGSWASDLTYEQQGIHNNGGRLNNTNSVGISLAGNFEVSEPTQAQMRTLNIKLREVVTRYNIPQENVVGHRDMKATACPGKNLYTKLQDIKNRAYAKEDSMFTDGNNHIVAVKSQGSDSVAVVRFVTGEEYRTLGQPPVQEVPRFNSLDDKGNLNPVILHQSIGDYYFENSELKKQVKSLEEQNSSLDAAVAEITIENNKIAAQYENALAINVATNNVIQNLTLENGALKERVEFLEAQVDNDLTWLDYLKLSISKLLGK
jgi:hypothetical protein